MPIRNGKLHKLCKKCGKSFLPSGRATKLCDKCKGRNSQINKWLKLSRKINNDNKIRINKKNT